MVEDLQTRLKQGELAALLDPALELEMLAKPNPLWWERTLWTAANRLVIQVAQRLRARTVMRALDEWVEELGHVPAEEEAWFWREQRAQLRGAPSRERRAELLAQMARGVALNEARHQAALVALGRRLVGLLPEPEPLYEAAVSVLERHAH